jgi:cytochrome c-type biogenesis protein CcmF
MPLVVCILFLMSVAPVLPWRQTTAGLLRTRLLWPAAAAVATLVGCVIGGVTGLNPLLAFGLGAFAGATALRQLFLEVRRRGLSGFGGASGGGMVVHLGVVLIAVAFAASHSFAHTTALTLQQGQTQSFDGHTFTFEGTRELSLPSRSNVTHIAEQASVRIDGGRVFAPALTNYVTSGETVPTPSVKSSLAEDIYLTFNSPPAPGQSSAVIGVIIEPLVSWLWVGGAVIAAGTLLAIWPGRRRRSKSDDLPSSSSAESSASSSSSEAEAEAEAEAVESLAGSVDRPVASRQ